MTRALALLCFASGASGLLYQVLWSKYLALSLGSAAWAQAAVIAVFLGGLALGSASLGPLADRVRSPLKFYARLELGICLLGLLSPSFLGRPDLPWLGLLALLAPTFLMGGTLPALARCAGGMSTQGVVARLYFLNSAGAALGALAAGFCLVPLLGLDLCVFLAAACNLAVGAFALLLAARRTDQDAGPAPLLSAEAGAIPAAAGAIPAEAGAIPAEAGAPAAPAPAPALGPLARLIGLSVFVSGAAALAYEIAWTRLFSLVLGSSAYSFSLMLAAFICGVALGSLALGRLTEGNARSRFALAELGAALGALAVLPLYERLPHISLVLGSLVERTPAGFYAHELLQGLLCFLCMLPPTFALGMTLPLACRLADPGGRIARATGRVFAWNTAGNVLGALGATLLLPFLGLKGLVLVAALLHAALGFAWLLATPRGPSRRALVAATCACALLFALGARPLDTLMLTSASFRRGGPAPSFAAFRSGVHAERLLYHKDDREGSVTVTEDILGVRFLKVNGKTDASTGTDMETQALLAHLPLLLKPARDVLIVGLGSGVTAASALKHPGARVSVLEISPAVVEAMPLFGALKPSDPVALRLGDAKTLLRRGPERYDLIVSEPSNPWIAGMGSLFSMEFYRDARARLAPGGLMAQWFHLYEMTDETARLLLRTFASSFPHATLWRLGANDVLLLGAAEPWEPDAGRLRALLTDPALARDLAELGIRKPEELPAMRLASDPELRALAGRGRVNEDRFPILEYQAARALFLNRTARLGRARAPGRATDRGNP